MSNTASMRKFDCVCFGPTRLILFQTAASTSPWDLIFQKDLERLARCSSLVTPPSRISCRRLPTTCPPSKACAVPVQRPSRPTWVTEWLDKTEVRCTISTLSPTAELWWKKSWLYLWPSQLTSTQLCWTPSRRSSVNLELAWRSVLLVYKQRWFTSDPQVKAHYC